MPPPKLIILRGPSGSGKTTVARNLFDTARRRTCLIEQDHYRFIFNPSGGGSKPNSDTIHKMIRQNVLAALQDGYDVILEGILSVKSYGVLLDDIFAAHPQENYMYYFDVSFEETVRRHEMRRTAQHGFGEADMKEWYPSAHRSHHALERIIPESSTMSQTLRRIRRETGI